jgi:hypothetical protein
MFPVMIRFLQTKGSMTRRHLALGAAVVHPLAGRAHEVGEGAARRALAVAARGRGAPSPHAGEERGEEKFSQLSDDLTVSLGQANYQ